MATSTGGAFAAFTADAWPFKFAGTLEVDNLCGGTPTDQGVVEAWLRSKFAASDDLIRAQAAEVMVERGVGLDEALPLVADARTLNGFKRDEDGQLYIEGRQLKAALKEAANVAANAGKITAKGWGNPDNANYRKGIKAWLPEHVFVREDRLYLGATEPSRVNQRFVHTDRGTGIQYEEVVDLATIEFTVATDHEFKDREWAMIWLTAEQLGIGATRSQGFGRFTVTRWERVE